MAVGRKRLGPEGIWKVDEAMFAEGFMWLMKERSQEYSQSVLSWKIREQSCYLQR